MNKYLITYRCTECNMESAYADSETAHCRYCDHQTEMTEVKKQEITPELLHEKLKSASENMLLNLQKAFEVMGDDVKDKFPANQDAEKEMLNLLARAKALKEKIEGLNMEKEEE